MTEKIMFLNYAYGGIRQRVPHLQKPQKADVLGQIIEYHNIDTLLLLEVLLDDPHVLGVLKEIFRYHSIDNKYCPTKPYASYPLLRKNGNAVFSKESQEVHLHDLNHGTKTLIHEVQLKSGVTLLGGHFALTKRTRTKQFQELIHLRVRKASQTIIGGDFNIQTLDEFTPFVRAGINPSIYENTFRGLRIKTRPIDNFLVGPKIKEPHAEVLSDVKISDHYPVILTHKGLKTD